MKKIILTFLIIFSLIPQVNANTPKGKFGFSASISPWMDTREVTFSVKLSDSWTFLLWGDFSFDKEELESVLRPFYIEDGYSWLLGPEIRKRLYYLDKYKVAPYLGILVNAGTGKYDLRHRYEQSSLLKWEKSYTVFEGGIELTFGVEYFMSEHFSLSIHTRLIKYHYYWIDLTTDYYYNTKKINYKTGYHVLDMYHNIPSLFIRFYF